MQFHQTKYHWTTHEYNHNHDENTSITASCINKFFQSTVNISQITMHSTLNAEIQPHRMPGNNASHKRLHTIMQPNSLKCNNTEAKKWNHITINSGKHTLTSGDHEVNPSLSK